MENQMELYGTLTNAGIPIEFLVAEIIAFPLASVYTYENPITKLYPDFQGDTMKLLWRNAESHIVQTIPDISIDMVLAIRDQFWFGKNLEKCEEISSFLKRVAGEFLEVRGAFAVPKVVGDDSLIKREHQIAPVTRRNNTLRWFSFSLPMDLFLGALGNPCGPPVDIDYLSPQLFRNLNDKGFAEPHFHIGAALEFPEFWVTTLCRLADTKLKDDEFQSPGAVFNEGRDLGPWLLRAALTRCLLARFLFTRKERNETFHLWLKGTFFKEILEWHGSTVLLQVKMALKEILAGKKISNSPISPYLRIVYREQGWMGNPPELVDSPDQIHINDPIAFLVRNGPGRQPSPEIQFVSKGLSYIEQSKGDLLFSSFFWQVTRIRCIYYRHVTQRPMTPGLLWFVRHYDRNKPGREKLSTKLLVRGAARTSGIDNGLRSLEVRNTPGNSVSEILKQVKDSMDALRNDNKNNSMLNDLSDCGGGDEHNKIEFGWIIHFAKIRGKEVVKGNSHPRWKDTNADPLHSGKGGSRYAGYYRKQKRGAQVLAQTIFNFPGSIRIIRGLDVCTDELGVPSWVFVPFFRYIRDAGNAASKYLLSRFGEEVPPLQMTVHTGEDYIHLLGGLRRIEESVRYFKLGPGDRIGHGMALGTDPGEWARKKNRVAMTREHRLFDLVWEWKQYCSHVIPCVAGRKAFIEREISRLSNIIFSRILLPYQLEHLVADLHDEARLKRIGFPDCKLPPFPNSDRDGRMKEEIERYKLLYDYLSDPQIFINGHETEWINIQPEIEPMRILQNHIRQIFLNLGLVVEVNPTSNLLIGNLADLKHHPFWQLNSPVLGNNSQPVALCIGSDDPLTFATCLRREYALLQESLIDGGLSASQAWNWVNEIRDTGMNSRFTVPLKNQHNDIYKFKNQTYLCHAIGLDKHVENMP
ncbi:MAG: hypothetical protein GY737_07755 [Desulfobacteraceae bacterium]|nr:hypothetical protein [Desulfobacteraceae bacterium]